MSEIEQENQQLKEEVTSLKAMMEQMSTQLAHLMAAQNRPPTPPPHDAVLWPVSSSPASTLPFTVVESRPWVTTVTTAPVSQTAVTFPQVTATTTFTPPLVHSIPYQEHEQIYHTDSVAGYDQVEDLHEKFEEKFEV